MQLSQTLESSQVGLTLSEEVHAGDLGAELSQFLTGFGRRTAFKQVEGVILLDILVKSIPVRNTGSGGFGNGDGSEISAGGFDAE